MYEKSKKKNGNKIPGYLRFSTYEDDLLCGVLAFVMRVVRPYFVTFEVPTLSHCLLLFRSHSVILNPSRCANDRNFCENYIPYINKMAVKMNKCNICHIYTFCSCSASLPLSLSFYTTHISQHICVSYYSKYYTIWC